MTIDAQHIVTEIGHGVAEALTTNKLFLGVEVDAFQNADIHPEYVTTVEVAKKFTGVDRYVSLETHMKELRKHARWLAWIKQKMTSASSLEIDSILADYKFGKRDSQRLDILVRSSDDTKPPLLIAEAKLGVKNLSGVKCDIERVVRLLTMYDDLGLLNDHNVYAAVLFHSMDKGNATGVAGTKVQKLLSGINARLREIKNEKPWVEAKASLLTIGKSVQPITGYTEHYEDGKTEDVFAKKGFTFAPGLVLLGNCTDINTAKF